MDVSIGKDITLTVPDHTTLTDEVRDHILYIGWRNILMDSHAGVTAAKVNGGDVQAESRAVAEKKLAALVAGELRTMRAARVPSDPIMDEAIKLVAAKVQKGNAKERRAEAVRIIEAADRTTPKYAALMAKARKNVEEANAINIDL